MTKAIVTSVGNTQLSRDRLRQRRQDENPMLVYLGSLAHGSRRTMTNSLETVARLVSDGKTAAVDFPWWELRYQHLTMIQSRLRENLSASSVNLIMTAVKQVLLRCRRLKFITSEQYAEITDIKRLKHDPQLRGRFIEREEIVAMLSSCTATKPIDVRDKALLMLLATGGLRRDEAAHVMVEDYDRMRQTVFVRKGKGGKKRTVTANASLMKALDAWVEVRGGHQPGPLFCPVYKGGYIHPDKQISHQTVYYVVDKVAKRANLSGGDISPHDFRRTFISMLLDNGTDIKTASKLVGHEQIETTGRYDRRGEKAMKKATDSLPSFEDGT